MPLLFPHMKYKPDGLDTIAVQASHTKTTTTTTSLPLPPRGSHPPRKGLYPNNRNTSTQQSTFGGACIDAKLLRNSQQPPSSPRSTSQAVTRSFFRSPQHALNLQKIIVHDDWDTSITTTTSTATITTCDSNASSSQLSFCEIPFVPKAKEQWYGPPLISVQHRFVNNSNELQHLRDENVMLRQQCRALQQQLDQQQQHSIG